MPITVEQRREIARNTWVNRARQALGPQATHEQVDHWILETQRNQLAKGRETSAARQKEEDRKNAERARQALGADASPVQIAAWIKDAKRANKNANASMREQRRQQQLAGEALQKVVAATAPPAAPTPPAPPAGGPGSTWSPPPTFQDLSPLPLPEDDLFFNDSVFGSFRQKDGVASVNIWRIASDRPEHRTCAPGFLNSIPIEEFSEEAISRMHGGGRYRVEAVDVNRRVIRRAELPISGKAKVYVPEESAVEPTATGGRFGPGSAFRVDGYPQQEDVPYWMRQQVAEQDRRMERLEALIENVVTKPTANSEDDKLERFKRELEARESAEQAKHERRMAEIKMEMAAKAAEDERKLAAGAAASAAAAGAQTDLLKTLLTTQASTNTSLMTALLSKKDDGGGTAAMFGSMLTGMQSVMKMQGEVYGNLLRDSLGGEDKRTTGERVLDMVEKGVSGLWDKTGDQVLLKLVEQVGKPKQGAQGLAFQAGSAFQLPDGRVVPPDVCAAFVARYKQVHGVEPSMEVCIIGLTDFMNNAMRSQQQAQQAPPTMMTNEQAAERQRLVDLANLTPAQGEELIRQETQRAAAQATAEGRTPEEIQKVVQSTSANAAAALRNNVIAARAILQGPVPPPPQQPVAPLPPAAVQAAAAAPQPQSNTYVPGPIPAPPAGVATMVAPPGMAGAGPIAPTSVSIPWMQTHFVTDLIVAFKQGANPIDFLEHAIAQKKMSEDARVMIGKVYDDAGKDEPVKGLVTKVGMMLHSRGVALPPEFLQVFQDVTGETWLETFFFSCACKDIAEARKEIDKE